MKKGLNVSQLLIELEVEARMTYMDYHLQLLHHAMESGDKDNVEFQKSQLVKIHNRLQELEYFPGQSVLV